MIGLGIESTAHTFSVAVIKNKKILSNIINSYKTKLGGMIPIEVAKHHEKIGDSVIREAIEKSGVSFTDLEFVAFSQGPGLAPCLLVGLRKAKELAKKFNLPLVGVNHCVSHLEIGELTGAKDPVLLYCSGANTQIIAYASKKYRIFGETLDMGIGNFIDTFARYSGLGFPGGKAIEELAKNSKNKSNLVELPYSVKGMDVAFAGLLTNLKQKLDSGKYPIEDLCFSLQETSFAMLIETAERAIAHLGKKELLLGGGVACNSRLQEMAKIMCKERNAKCFVPEKQFLQDNAGMIAFLGQKMFKAGIKIKPNELEKADINSSQRTDQVNVTWKN